MKTRKVGPFKAVLLVANVLLLAFLLVSPQPASADWEMRCCRESPETQFCCEDCFCLWNWCDTNEECEERVQ